MQCFDRLHAGTDQEIFYIGESATVDPVDDLSCSLVGHRPRAERGLKCVVLWLSHEYHLGQCLKAPGSVVGLRFDGSDDVVGCARLPRREDAGQQFLSVVEVPVETSLGYSECNRQPLDPQTGNAIASERLHRRSCPVALVESCHRHTIRHRTELVGTIRLRMVVEVTVDIGQIVAAVLIGILAVAHSVLGEQGILKPLFKDDRWHIGMARWASERILRFAWHLTSVAWIGLASIAVGADPLIAVATVALITGAVILVMLPGHLAWPLAFLAAGGAAWSAEVLPQWLMVGLATVTAALAAGLSILHLYWAVGGTRWLSEALPDLEGDADHFTPPQWMSAAVAFMLAAFAGLLLSGALGVSAGAVRLATAIGGVVLVVRAVGDGRLVGFTKKVRQSSFARRDDKYFTPTVVLLAFGAMAALLV